MAEDSYKGNIKADINVIEGKFTIRGGYNVWKIKF